LVDRADDAGEGGLSQQELVPDGIRPGGTGTAGTKDSRDGVSVPAPKPCYTSVPSRALTRVLHKWVARTRVRLTVPQPQIDPVDLVPQDNGPPVSEAVRFGGGRYPTRVRASGAPKWYESLNYLLLPETHTASTSEAPLPGLHSSAKRHCHC